ncbi:uncharacterized protein MELLADRAFT_110678 [Melampsora larici-populina 98AG31]|uniref:Uncharacterized protein n=1 Tax=Melampsora larici-populina (strain 98AG31 / pathotype 3-4-7) TaxID=747676 RepID=F4S0L1_MELLP|nr:uncharacterized protein MELLADRAFT_110678 [Melampsora larici-populina 98AG31]EGG01784.1 hypothetical protein MELLADRAFT_110678 [Melampsora larici-populina 98AG31]
MIPSSQIASSECEEGDLWGSDDEAGLDDETSATYHQTLNQENTTMQDEDPTSSILNLPPDSPPAISSSSLPPTAIRRHPPVFQGAFSQARVQQPMMRSFTDAFNQRLPSLFHSSSALPTHPTGSETGSISPLVDELDFGNLNPSALSGVREQYPEVFEEAAARFLEDFVTGPSISPQDPASPDQHQKNRGSIDSSFGLMDSNHQDEENEELSGSLNDSTVEGRRNRPFVRPSTTTSGAQASSSALRLSISSASGSNLPETDLSSTSSFAQRNSDLSLPSSSSVLNNTNQPKPKPPGLFLPPRAPRLANDDRYTQTPFNSPCASGPSTPIPSYQPLPRTSRANRNSTSQGKPDRTGMLSSKKRKSTVPLPAPAPPPPPASSVAERRLSTVHDNLLKASASDGKIGTGSERRTVSGLPRRADIDQVRLLRQIRELRRGDGSSATIEKLEQEWEALLRRSDGLEAALELKRKATEHCLYLRRMKDALGSELVRVQIEESVLRHVRGIVANISSGEECANEVSR